MPRPVKSSDRTLDLRGFPVSVIPVIRAWAVKTSRSWRVSLWCCYSTKNRVDTIMSI
jgi:hypothetical protein